MKIADVTSNLDRKKVRELKLLFDKPIPLDGAIDILKPYINDKDLFDRLQNELAVNGNKDARNIIAEWLKQNVPDLYKAPIEWAPPYESPITSHPDITGE